MELISRSKCRSLGFLCGC